MNDPLIAGDTVFHPTGQGCDDPAVTMDPTPHAAVTVQSMWHRDRLVVKGCWADK